jgi:hypothetical protein
VTDEELQAEWRAVEALLDGDDLDAVIVRASAAQDATPQAAFVRLAMRTLLLITPILQVRRGADMKFKKHRRGDTLVVTHEASYGIAKKRGGVWTYDASPGIIRGGEPCPRAIAIAFDAMPELPKPRRV